MLAPGDIAERAGRQAQPARLGGPRRRTAGRSSPAAAGPWSPKRASRVGDLVAGGDQRVLGAARPAAARLYRWPFAQAEGGEDHAVRLGQAQHAARARARRTAGCRGAAATGRGSSCSERRPSRPRTRARSSACAAARSVVVDDVQRIAVCSMWMRASGARRRRPDRRRGRATSASQSTPSRCLSMTARAVAVAVACCPSGAAARAAGWRGRRARRGRAPPARGCRRRDRRSARRASGMPERTPSADSRASSSPASTRTRTAAAALDLGDEVGAVARRRAPPRSRAGRAASTAIASASRDEARRDCRSASVDAVLVQPAGRVDAAAEAAQHLLVEQRQRRARRPLEDDEAHRVGADIDDARRGRRRVAGAVALRRVRATRQAFLQLERGALRGALRARCRGRRGSGWS